MREHQKEGNLESFEACSQGAGRGMSRRVAKHAFSLADQHRRRAATGSAAATGPSWRFSGCSSCSRLACSSSALD